MKRLFYTAQEQKKILESSDIDLTLFEKDLNFYFDDSFLPHKLDISIFDKLEDPDFINHIEHIGILFYQKN